MKDGQLALHQKIAQLASLRGLTQIELARRTGLSRMSIYRYFNGKTEMKARDLEVILESVGVSLGSELTELLKRMAVQKDELPKEPVFKDANYILEALPPRIRTTLLEQIVWWGERLKVESEACEKLRMHLRGLL